MSFEKLSKITVQQMLIFIEVVEQKSFFRAASRLNLTPSAISKSLSRLSSTLGCPLFVGTTRNWELTEAGKIFYDNWKEHLGAMSACCDRVSEELLQAPSLKIGFANFVFLGGVYAEAINDFSNHYPNVELSSKSESAVGIISSLHNQKYDMLLLPFFMTEGISEDLCDWRWVAKSKLTVLVPKTNPLASKEKLTLEDIKGEQFAFVQEKKSYLYQLRRFSGLELELPPKQFDTAETLRLQYSISGYLLLTDPYFDARAFYGTVTKELVNGPDGGVVAIWRKDSQNPHIKPFLRYLQKHSGLTATH